MSLLIFPSMIPWMTAGWLIAFTVLALYRQPAWAPLLLCALFLVAKGSVMTFAWAVFVAALVATAYRRMTRRDTNEHPQPRGVRIVQLAALWGAWAYFAFDWYVAAHSGRTPALDSTRPVACLGDSLTAYGFPDVLAKQLAVPVVNHGHDGISTSDALRRLPEVLADRPQVVVVELGGHDFLRRRGRQATRANLEQIITQCRSQGAEVVLMEIPRGAVYDPFHGLERGLARKYDLELVPDTPIRYLVFGSPVAPPGMWLPRDQHLSDDGLHPNARGNEVLADFVAATLVRLYGPEVPGSENSP
jgi:lysophospholipase L1-like esterase